MLLLVTLACGPVSGTPPFTPGGSNDGVPGPWVSSGSPSDDPQDTGATTDPGQDTGSGDTGGGDTDTGSGDTGSGDTGSGDTGSGDTGSGDTGSQDSGGQDSYQDSVYIYDSAAAKRGSDRSAWGWLEGLLGR